MFVITYTATTQILRLHSGVRLSHFKEVQPNWYPSFKTDQKSALETCSAWTDTTKHSLLGVVDPHLCQSWQLLPFCYQLTSEYANQYLKFWHHTLDYI
jgi:hypothetical protein